MQLTYKNANRIGFGVAIIISTIWIFLDYTIIVGYSLIFSIMIFIMSLFLKDKPEKPTKFNVIFPYVIGIVSLMVCLLFNLLTYLFFPLIFLNGAILYHFSFIALKRQRGKRKYKLHESKYSDREKIASSTEEKA